MNAPSDTTFPGILAIFNNVAPGREAEFEEWFQHEHLAERLAVPGFLLGRRHEAISGQPGYFNFYVTQSVAVLKSPAYLGRLDAPTPMTRTIMSEIFKDMIRTVCHRTFRLGAMRGTGVVAVRFSERPPETVLKGTIERLMLDKAVAGKSGGPRTRMNSRFPWRNGCAAAIARSRSACWSRHCACRRPRRSQRRWRRSFQKPRSESIGCFVKSWPTATPEHERAPDEELA
jgi:hypothetical protein